MAAEATAWPWSGAAAHGGAAEPDACLEMAIWRQEWSEASGRNFLEAGETEAG
jgi:hypothetical protein